MGFRKNAKTKDLSSETKEDIIIMAKSDQLTIDIAHMLILNSSNVCQFIAKHCETGTMQNGPNKTSEHFDRR